MVYKFLTIAITSPEEYPHEVERISEILTKGLADIVHIRKPHWSEEKTADLLKMIPAEFYSRIKIHDHFSLLKKFPLLGVHLNSRNDLAPGNVSSVSRSFHDIEQLPLSAHYDYVTLSPVYDSISKSGYKSSFSLEELKPLVKGKNVIALGGVTPDKFPELMEAGFAGAAMLGYFWKQDSRKDE